MNHQHQPEEIDIVQFFKAIGLFFKSIFNSIKNAFLSVFHFFLDFLLYLKKNYLFLGAGILVGLILSFFNNSSKNKLFEAKARVHTNYQSQFLLQEQFEAFNYMIKTHKTDLLAKELGVDEETAKKYVKFDLEPLINDVFLIDEYDNYLRTKDTVVYQFIEYKDFKKNFIDNPEINPYWELTVKATAPDVFENLNKALIKNIENDQSIARRQKNLTMALELAKDKNLKSLQDVDTMRAIYNKVDLAVAQKDPTATASMIINKNNNLTHEWEEAYYNLFDIRMITLNNLENAILRLNKFSSPLVFLSSFPSIGKKEGGILYNNYVRNALLGFLTVLFILLLWDFNKYLNRYQQRKQVQNHK